MTPSPLPPWPSRAPTSGAIRLRAVLDADAAMAQELSTDPYIPHIGTLPAHADRAEAHAWVQRQRGRHAEGSGFSFAMEEALTGRAVGHCGLWLQELDTGLATAGYAVVPSARGRGYAAQALAALTEFGGTIPGLQRIALYIEPWNAASIRTAERAGYTFQELLPAHRVIAGEARDMLLYSATREAPPPEGSGASAPDRW
ncbi:GNAT family protein [Zhihengliuella alba]|uniref:GNAT family protein n=1 Tax=Zhihengliuella alba TaxID=547018 RepID=A0ABP7DYD4_9MICC